MKNIAVVIPVYNAEHSLAKVFERIPKTTYSKIKEFILVNDGSTDSSQDIIESLMKQYDNLVVITNSNNLGYGAVQKIGFRRALADRMDIVVLLHADGQYPPEMILDILEPIENARADVAGGSRFLWGNVLRQGMPFLRYLGMILLDRIENLVFRQKLTIYHSGYRAYSRKALEVINFEGYSNYFSFDTEMLLGALINQLKICEIPIPTYYGKGKSHLNPIKYTAEILLVVVKYLFRQYHRG